MSTHNCTPIKDNDRELYNEFKIILPEEINFIKEYYLKVGNISEIVTHINEKRKTEGI